jgi:16S rRNA (uracil1498-N3)-methyltransferase
MKRFFVDSIGRVCEITGQDARHIAKSLRLRPGEKIMLCDGRGQEAAAEIVKIGENSVLTEAEAPGKSEAEPGLHVALYLALAKGDKTDWVVQKAVELGASEIVLVLTRRCVARPKPGEDAKKIARWQTIAREAAMQSGRGVIPKVRGVLGYRDALSEMAAFDQAFLLYEGQCRPLGEALLRTQGGTLALMSGSEGGFEPAEAEEAEKAGVVAVSLGKRILRCETAPVAALAAVMFSLNEMT